MFAVPDVSWQTEAPPTRHPFPARYVPGLDAGDEVTIGVPGRYFLDGQVVVTAKHETTTLPGESQGREALAVAAPYGYWLSRAFPTTELIAQKWPVDFTWVYRDELRPEERHPGTSAVAEGPTSWLTHVRPTMQQPPVRHPHPAREAESLTGRTLRLQHERGAWSWWVGVGEPVDRDGDFVVHLMRPPDYWLTQAVLDPDAQVHVVPLHRLWAYD